MLDYKQIGKEIKENNRRVRKAMKVASPQERKERRKLKAKIFGYYMLEALTTVGIAAAFSAMCFCFGLIEGVQTALFTLAITFGIITPALSLFTLSSLSLTNQGFAVKKEKFEKCLDKIDEIEQTAVRNAELGETKKKEENLVAVSLQPEQNKPNQKTLSESQQTQNLEASTIIKTGKTEKGKSISV